MRQAKIIGRIAYGVNRPWGESSNVWAKRPWGETYSGRNVLLPPTCFIIPEQGFYRQNCDIIRLLVMTIFTEERMNKSVKKPQDWTFCAILSKRIISTNWSLYCVAYHHYFYLYRDLEVRMNYTSRKCHSFLHYITWIGTERFICVASMWFNTRWIRRRW